MLTFRKKQQPATDYKSKDISQMIFPNFNNLFPATLEMYSFRLNINN